MAAGLAAGTPFPPTLSSWYSASGDWDETSPLAFLVESETAY